MFSYGRHGRLIEQVECSFAGIFPPFAGYEKIPFLAKALWTGYSVHEEKLLFFAFSFMQIVFPPFLGEYSIKIKRKSECGNRNGPSLEHNYA